MCLVGNAQTIRELQAWPRASSKKIVYGWGRTSTTLSKPETYFLYQSIDVLQRHGPRYISHTFLPFVEVSLLSTTILVSSFPFLTIAWDTFFHANRFGRWLSAP